ESLVRRGIPLLHLRQSLHRFILGAEAADQHGHLIAVMECLELDAAVVEAEKRHALKFALLAEFLDGSREPGGLLPRFGAGLGLGSLLLRDQFEQEHADAMRLLNVVRERFGELLDGIALFAGAGLVRPRVTLDAKEVVAVLRFNGKRVIRPKGEFDLDRLNRGHSMRHDGLKTIGRRHGADGLEAADGRDVTSHRSGRRNRRRLNGAWRRSRGTWRLRRRPKLRSRAARE